MTNSRTIRKPQPGAAESPIGLAIELTKTFEDALAVLAANARPTVVDGQHELRPPFARFGLFGDLDAQRDAPAAGREFEGIGQQIHGDALELLWVDQVRPRAQLQLDLIFDAEIGGERAKARGERTQERAYVRGFALQFDTNGVGARQLQQIVDVPEQQTRVALDDCERRVLLGVEPGCFAQILNRTEDQRQRSAELVAHVGEYLGLEFVQVLQPRVRARKLFEHRRQIALPLQSSSFSGEQGIDSHDYAAEQRHAADRAQRLQCSQATRYPNQVRQQR